MELLPNAGGSLKSAPTKFGLVIGGRSVAC